MKESDYKTHCGWIKLFNREEYGEPDKYSVYYRKNGRKNGKLEIFCGVVDKDFNDIDLETITIKAIGVYYA